MGPQGCCFGDGDGGGTRPPPLTTGRGERDVFYGVRLRLCTPSPAHRPATIWGSDLGRTRRFLRRAFAPLHAVAGTPPGDHLGIRFGVQSGRSTDLRSPPRSAHTVIVQRTDKYA